MYLDLSVAVIMPVYNEQDHVAGALSSVPEFVDAIIVVDDGSTDSTWNAVSRMDDDRLMSLRHSSNLGVGAAIKTGYRRCLTTSADVIVVMDGDGQMDARDLPTLLDRVADGVEFVKGNRFHHASIAAMPLARWIGNAVLSWLTRIACDFPGSLDSQCGYSAINRAALERLNLCGLYNRYGFHNEMLFLCRSAGLVIDTVPVRTVYGDEVSHINPFIAVPTILWLIARTYISRRFARKLSAYRDGAVTEPVSGD